MPVTYRLFGHGVDVAAMSRFTDVVSRFGDKFLNKCLHPSEFAAYHRIESPEAREKFLASRWAVKEAVVKATGKRLLFPEIALAGGSTGTLDCSSLLLSSE